MNTETEIKTDEQSESDLKRLLCNLPTRAKIQLIGGELKTCEITTIQYRCGGVYSITVKYPLGNDYFDFLTYYFDGRKVGE